MAPLYSGILMYAEKAKSVVLFCWFASRTSGLQYFATKPLQFSSVQFAKIDVVLSAKAEC